MVADDEAPITEFLWIEGNGRVFGSGDKWDTHAGCDEWAKAGETTLPVWLRLRREGSTIIASMAPGNVPLAQAQWQERCRLDFHRDNTAAGVADYKSQATLDASMHFGMFVNSGTVDSVGMAAFAEVEARKNNSDVASERP
jgi:hypothetical protein